MPRPTSPGITVPLVLPAAPGGSLSKHQRAFNRLVRRVAELERLVAADRDRLQALLDAYHERVAPAERGLAEAQVALAKTLAAADAEFPLRAAAKKRLRSLVQFFCGEAFYFQPPDADTEAFYDEWADLPYREAAKRQREDFEEDLAAEIKDAFGLEDEIGDDSSMENLLRRAREKAAAEEAALGSEDRRASAKSRREADRNEAAHRSVRAVYLSLAKVLHPDKVSDESERGVREEGMKEAAGAYRRGDLAALLRLELRWMTRDEAAIASLPPATLRSYTTALERQAEALEEELAWLADDPRFAPIHGVAGLPHKMAATRLKQLARDLKAATAQIRRLVVATKSCRSRADLTALLQAVADAW